jgi:hypothetical protein
LPRSRSSGRGLVGHAVEANTQFIAAQPLLKISHLEADLREVAPRFAEDGGPQATARHHAVATHLEAAGVRVEGPLPGWIGAAVPVDMSEHAFAKLLASAPYPIEIADQDEDA